MQKSGRKRTHFADNLAGSRDKSRVLTFFYFFDEGRYFSRVRKSGKRQLEAFALLRWRRERENFALTFSLDRPASMLHSLTNQGTSINEIKYVLNLKNLLFCHLNASSLRKESKFASWARSSLPFLREKCFAQIESYSSILAGPWATPALAF